MGIPFLHIVPVMVVNLILAAFFDKDQQKPFLTRFEGNVGYLLFEEIILAHQPRNNASTNAAFFISVLNTVESTFKITLDSSQ